MWPHIQKMTGLGPEYRALACYLFIHLVSQLNFLSAYYMPDIVLFVR